MRLPWAVGIVVLAAATSSEAQRLAEVSGQVKDETGAVLPGVLVTATHEATGTSRSVTTDSGGFYRFNALGIGTYRIRLELDGFQPLEVEDYRLGVGDSAVLNLEMKLATVQESVTVTTAAPVIETTRSDLTGRIDPLQMDEVPLSGRNWLVLATLAPGVKSDGTGAQGNTPEAGVGDGRTTSVLLDGASVQNRSTKVSIDVEVSKEIIGEFEVITNRFDAQIGHAGTAVVNAVSKSGSDLVSGSAFGYFRDDALNAADFFTGEVEPYSNRQYGGTLGGPVIRGKTHYFLSYERQDEPKTVSANTGLALLDAPVDAGDRRNLYFGRVDHQLAPNHRLSGRVNVYQRKQENVGVGGIITPSNSRREDFLIKRYNAGLDSIFADRWVNQFLVTYLDTFRKFDPMDPGPMHSFPSLNLGGRPNVGHEIPSYWFVRNDTSVFFDQRGNHNVKFGAEYEFGKVEGFFANAANGIFAYDQDPPNIDTCCQGYDQSTWDTSQFPIPARFTQALGDYSLNAPNHIVGAYLQDDWTIAQRLTLNLGVRWDAEFGSLAHDFTGLVAQGNENDINNIQPRLGFAWDLTGSGKTIVRGGSGLYYDQVFLNVTFNVQRSNTGQQVTVTTFNTENDPDFANDPLGGRTFDDFKEEQGAINVSAFPDVIEQPHIWSWSLGVAQEITPDLGFTVDYVGQSSNSMIRSIDSNLFCCTPDGQALPIRSGSYPDLGGSFEGAGRPDPRFNLIQLYTTVGRSRYHGLQVGLKKRMSNNHLFGVSYLLSKNEDDHSGAFSYPNNQFDLADEYGTSLRDQRHRFVANWVAQLPYAFNFSGVLYTASGRPRSTSTGGIDINGDGISGGDRPICGVDPRFAPGCSALGVADGVRVPRNAFRTDSVFRLDLRLSRRFTFGGVSFDPMFEVFNVFNRENYDPGNYNTNLTSAQFGQPGRSDLQPYLPRQVQLAVRMSF